MGVEDHKKHAPKQVRVFVISVSDSRTVETDSSGKVAKELIAEAGHVVAGYQLVRDEPVEVAGLIQRIAKEKMANVVVTTGGTGVSRRDSTYEAVAGLLEKRLDGFGELFRMLSFQEVGSAAMLSRAVAGLYQGLVIFATPGSPGAVKLALKKLILPEVGHISFEVKR
jgi:molybdenum cofactor biosynthesis protein B